ncbi:MAG: hypothetical protein DSY70_05160 [Desulfobulbus sp.]|nr:MAG: hypothetical protein DSY70_05160 [Desulfobulbus sp.]
MNRPVVLQVFSTHLKSDNLWGIHGISGRHIRSCEGNNGLAFFREGSYLGLSEFHTLNCLNIAWFMVIGIIFC